MNNQEKDPTALIALIVGTILVASFIAFVVFASKSENNKKTASRTYSGAVENAPKAVLSQSYFNYGPLTNKTDLVTSDFMITNSGRSDLTIYKLTTSCHCTTAQLTYQDTSSPKWGMASSSSWQVSIKPGDTATISVEYDPKQMINDGLIQRAIYITTNDPDNPELIYQLDMENDI